MSRGAKLAQEERLAIPAEELEPKYIAPFKQFIDEQILPSIAKLDPFDKPVQKPAVKKADVEDEKEATIGDLEQKDSTAESLRNPCAPSQRSAKEQITSLVSIPNWMVTDMIHDAKEKLNITYTHGQVRLMLLKGKHHMECFMADLKKDKHVPLWWEHLAKGGEENIPNAYFAAFLYTVNCLHCECKDEAKCVEAMKNEHTAFSGKDTRAKFTMKDVHWKPTEVPDDFEAWGWSTMPWAVMNWTMRVAKDGKTEAIRAKAKIGKDVFEPFARALSYCLRSLPQQRLTVFRGIRGKVHHPYKPLDQVLWPAFSSTALEGAVAKGFMGKDEGTFFIINTRTAVMIDCFSWFPRQKEALLDFDAVFEVQSRMSNTLLDMLGSSAEIITMVEVAEGDLTVSRQHVVDTTVASMNCTNFVFEDFLKTYVTGTVGQTPATGSSEKITAVMKRCCDHLNAQVDGKDVESQFQCIFVGSGGSGKTSAMLYSLCELMTLSSKPNEPTPAQTNTQKKNSATAAKKKPAVENNGSAVFVPVFVALPQTNFDDQGGIDDYVLNVLRIKAEELQLLSSAPRRLVVLLDSLDEVKGTPTSEMVTSILDRNPLIKQHASALFLSTRNDFLEQTLGGLPPNQLLQSHAEVRYVRPFSDSDVEVFLQAIHNRENVKSGLPTDQYKWKYRDEHNVFRNFGKCKDLNTMVKKLDIGKDARIPYVLNMCTQILVDEEGNDLIEDARRSLAGAGRWEVYGAYLRLLAHQADDVAAAIEAKQARVHVAQLIDVIMKAERDIAVGLYVDKAVVGTVSKYAKGLQTLKGLPLRVENVYATDGSAQDVTLSFRHKSLQEFLVAEYLVASILGNDLNDPKHPFLVSGNLSSSPNLMDFVTERLMRENDPSILRQRIERLIEMVKTTGKDPCFASNAMALLAQTRTVLSTFTTDFKNINIEKARLDGAMLRGLDFSGAKLHHCSAMSVDFTECTFEGCSLEGTDLHQMPRSKMPEGEPIGHFALSVCGNFVITSTGAILYFKPGEPLKKVASLKDFPEPYHGPKQFVKCCHVVVSPCGRFVGCGGAESKSWCVYRVYFDKLLREEMSATAKTSPSTNDEDLVQVPEMAPLMKYVKPADAHWILVRRMTFSLDGEFVFVHVREGNYEKTMIARTSGGKSDGSQHDEFTWQKQGENDYAQGVPYTGIFYRNPDPDATRERKTIFAASVKQEKEFGRRGSTSALCLFYFDDSNGIIAEEPFGIYSCDHAQHLTYLPKRQALMVGSDTKCLELYAANPAAIDFSDEKQLNPLAAARDVVTRRTTNSTADKDDPKDYLYFSDSERFLTCSSQGVVLMSLIGGIHVEKVMNIVACEMFQISPDEKYIYIGRGDLIYTFAVEASGPELRKPDCHQVPVLAVHCDVASRKLISSSRTGTFMTSLDSGATLSKNAQNKCRVYTATPDGKFTIVGNGSVSDYVKDSWGGDGVSSSTCLINEASKTFFAEFGSYTLTKDMKFMAVKATIKTDKLDHLQSELKDYTDKDGITTKRQEERRCIRFYHLDEDALKDADRQNAETLGCSHIAFIYTELFDDKLQKWYPERLLQMSPDEKYLLVMELLLQRSKDAESYSTTNTRRLSVYEIPNLRDTTTRGEGGLPRMMKHIASSDFPVSMGHQGVFTSPTTCSLIARLPGDYSAHHHLINVEIPSLEIKDEQQRIDALTPVHSTPAAFQETYKWNQLIVAPDGHTCVGARYTAADLYAIHLFDAQNDSGWKKPEEAEKARKKPKTHFPKKDNEFVKQKEDFSKRFDLQKDKTPQQLHGFSDKLVASFSADGQYLLYADPSQKGDRVYVVKVKHDEEKGVAGSEFVQSIFVGAKASELNTFTLDGELCCVVGTKMGGVSVFAVKTGRLIQQFGPQEQQLAAHGAKGVDTIKGNIGAQLLLSQLLE